MRPRHALPIWLLGLALLTGGVALAPPAGAQAKKPIKIGFLAPLTGGAAQVGRGHRERARDVPRRDRGNQMAGRKVELIVEDSRGDPTSPSPSCASWSSSDRVHIVVGVLFGHIGYALAPEGRGVPDPDASSPSSPRTTSRSGSRTKWVVRTGGPRASRRTRSASTRRRPWATRRSRSFGSDYAFGYEVVGGFQRTFEEAGGQIIQKLWVPLGAMDLAPYISKIQRDADAVFTIVAGGSTLQFSSSTRTRGCTGRSR